jgi:hypothetical protein
VRHEAFSDEVSDLTFRDARPRHEFANVHGLYVSTMNMSKRCDVQVGQC